MAEKYDVGVLGVWFGCNYGSIATYYALEKTIESFGKSVLMVHRPWLKPYDQKSMEKRHSLRFAREYYQISESYQVKDMGNSTNSAMPSSWDQTRSGTMGSPKFSATAISWILQTTERRKSPMPRPLDRANSWRLGIMPKRR